MRALSIYPGSRTYCTDMTVRSTGSSCAALARASAACLLLLAGCAGRGEATVAAASSLRAAMPALLAAWRAQSHKPVAINLTYGASGSLRRQVEAGAPTHAVFLASAAQVDRLLEQGLMDTSTRVVVASNRLVLAGPARSEGLSFEGLASLAPGQLLAMGDPDTAPVGRYSREYLQALGSWPAVKQRTVYAANTAAVLAYARRGEVAAAIVYDSDLLGVDDMLLLDRARPGLATQPLLVAALSDDAPDELADFLSFVASQAGQKVLADYGFLAPPGDTR